MTSNLPVRRGYLTLAHLMSGEPRPMKMPNCLKKKIKRWHDKRIQKREFNVGDYVLLFNSHLRFFAGKLLSKWEGPYVIEEVYCHSPSSAPVAFACFSCHHVYISNEFEMGMTEPPAPPFNLLGFTKIFFNEPKMAF